MSFVPQAVALEDGSMGVLVEENGQIVMKSLRNRDVVLGRVAVAEQKAECKLKIDAHIDNLRQLIARIQVRCQGLATLAQACSMPVAVGRAVQAGDVVEGPNGNVPPGLLQSIELEYGEDYKFPMGLVFTGNGSVYPHQLDILRHASAKTLTETGDRARCQEAEWRKTIAHHQAEIDRWAAVSL